MTSEIGSFHVDAPLLPADVLVHAGLYQPGTRGTPQQTATERLSGVCCGRPLIYPVPVADLPPFLRLRAGALPRDYYGMLLAFDLDELTAGDRYTSVHFDVALADEHAVVMQMHGDGGAAGLSYGFDPPAPASPVAARMLAASAARPGWLWRLAPRPRRPRSWSTGAQTNRFGWRYDDPRGELLPRTYGMHALLEVTAGTPVLHGALSVHVRVRGHRWGPAGGNATIRDTVAFAEDLPRRPEPARASVRLCMAADVAGYSTHDNPATERIQRCLVRLLADARRRAGIDEAAVTPQAQGDGQFTVLPTAIDESTVIPGLLHGLADGLRGADERIRLRVALHRGLVKPADNGWVGTASIAVHRILDSPPLRAALRDHEAAGFVLGVPDVLYQDVIRHLDDPPADSFRQVRIDLPAKRFTENAWLYVPGPTR